jgi:hypothetical protein
MADTLVVAGNGEENTGYRFSWGLVIAGGVIATAVTFALLVLGAGFGLLLVNPVTHAGPTLPTFLTGGAIYFVVAQAFGLAVGGHVVGRILGRLYESKVQEEFRAEAHGFAVWAATALITLAIVGIAGATATTTGAATAALYGNTGKAATAEPTAFIVDKLYRPAGASFGVVTDVAARDEASRIVDASLLTMSTAPDDQVRLAALVSRETGLSHADAMDRVNAVLGGAENRVKQAANVARKAASYASLWTALSLLFGLAIAMTAAVLGREEDDREALA